MQIIGRITRNATVSQLPGERSVVNFSIAINDSYKPKSGERKEFTTYVNCSYWIGTAIADRLLKGALVELSGRIYVNAYTDMQGKAKASLNCHVNQIKIHQPAKPRDQAKPTLETGTTATERQPEDDLPF